MSYSEILILAGAEQQRRGREAANKAWELLPAGAFWIAVREDQELTHARSVLSFHEIRTVKRHATAALEAKLRALRDTLHASGQHGPANAITALLAGEPK